MPKLKNISADEWAAAGAKLEEALYALHGLSDRVEKKYFDALPDKQFDRDLLNIIHAAAEVAKRIQAWRTVDDMKAETEALIRARMEKAA